MYYSRPELNPNSSDQPGTIIFLISGEENSAVSGEAEAAAESIRGDGFASYVLRVSPESFSPRGLFPGLSSVPGEGKARPPLILSDNQRLLDIVLSADIPAAGLIPASYAEGSSSSPDSGSGGIPSAGGDEQALLRAPFLVSEPGEVYPDDFVKIWQRQMGFPWTVFETERLAAREAVPSDAGTLMEICSDRETARMLPAAAAEYSGPRNESARRLAQYIENVYPVLGCGYWSICLKESGEMIGWAGLSLEKGDAELGYVIHPSYRRRGFGLEACRAIVDYAVHALGFASVIAEIPPDNIPSLKLIRRLGFVPAGDSYSSGTRMRSTLLRFVSTASLCSPPNSPSNVHFSSLSDVIFKDSV